MHFQYILGALRLGQQREGEWPVFTKYKKGGRGGGVTHIRSTTRGRLASFGQIQEVGVGGGGGVPNR